MGFKLSQKAKGISSIIGSCFFYLVLGSTYIWGSINVYAISYFKTVSSDEASMVFPFGSVIGNFGIILSFSLILWIGFRMNIYLSIVLIFGFFFASTFCTDFWSFFGCFGVGFGFTIGFLYLTMMYNNYKYFPNRRGLIGGIGMGVYGLAALVSNYILLLIINPNNVKAEKNPNTGEYFFPDEIANHFPTALRYLSYYFLGCMIVGALLVFEFKEPIEETGKDSVIIDVVAVEDQSMLLNNKRDEIRRDLLPKSLQDNDEFPTAKEAAKEDPNDIQFVKTVNPTSNLEPYTTTEACVETKNKNQKKSQWSLSSFDSHDERRCFSLLDAFKSRVFYVMCGMIFMSVSNGYFIATNFKNYGMTKMSDDQFLTLVGSLGSMFNGGGRFLWGALYDKFDFKKVYTTVLIMQMIIIVTLRFISAYEIPYLIWVCGALLCEGGNFVLFPPLSLKVFGPDVGSKIYSLLILVCGISNLTQFGLNLALRPLMGFETEFYIYLGMTVFAFVLCISSDLRYKK